MGVNFMNTKGVESMKNIVYVVGATLSGVTYYLVNRFWKKKPGRLELEEVAREKKKLKQIEYPTGDSSVKLREDLVSYLSQTIILTAMAEKKILTVREDLSERIQHLPEVKISMYKFFDSLFKELGVPCVVRRVLYKGNEWHLELEITSSRWSIAKEVDKQQEGEVNLIH